MEFCVESSKGKNTLLLALACNGASYVGRGLHDPTGSNLQFGKSEEKVEIGF